MAKKNVLSSLSQIVDAAAETNQSEVQVADVSPTREKNKKRRVISVDKLIPNPYNHFSTEEDDEFLELVENIKKDGPQGVIIVAEENEDGKHFIISGHRRWRAYIKLGIPQVPIEIDEAYLDEPESEMIAKVARGNVGMRQRQPYEFAIMLKKYYTALNAEGLYEKSNMKNIASERFSIAPRTLYNYDMLSTLPDDILIMGCKHFISSQEGVTLASAYQNEKYKKLAENAMKSLTSIYESKDSVSQKEEKVKEVFKALKKATKRKDVSEDKKSLLDKNKEVKVSLLVKKINKLTSVETLSYPTTPAEKKKALAAVDSALQMLLMIKERLNE